MNNKLWEKVLLAIVMVIYVFFLFFRDSFFRGEELLYFELFCVSLLMVIICIAFFKSLLKKNSKRNIGELILLIIGFCQMIYLVIMKLQELGFV